MNDTVPKSACCLSIGEVEVGTNGDGAKTAQFRMVARSGQPIEHPYWGRIVHDNTGFSMSRGRVAIDYGHNTDEVIGYANHVRMSETGDLEATGALTPFNEGDRASEVIFKAQQGVPWEASINFGGSGLELEKVEEGKSTEVNGYEFNGPGVVVRKWPLRGIAVCPYGADQYTSTEFSEGERISVSFREDFQMAKENLFADVEAGVIDAPVEEEKAAEVEVVETVDAEADTDTEEAAEVDAEPVAAVESELAEPSGIDFMTAFGDAQGAIYFARGLSFSEAQSEFTKAQAAEIKELKAQLKLATDSSGDDAPASFTEKQPKKEKYNPLDLSAFDRK